MTADRGEYVAGLRALADLLERDDALPLPAEGAKTFEWNIWPHEGIDVPAEMARLRRIFGGQWKKNEPAGDFNSKYYRLTRPLHGVTLELCSYRETVCERVVTGTREVVEDVPVAFEQRTTVVEDVEWVCKPLLADADTAVAR